MFCPNCGNQLPDGSNFCGSCGMNLTSAETKSFSGNSENEVTSESGKAGVGICIVSFLFPIVGIILYAVNKKNKLEYAKTVGRWAVIGMIVGIAFSAIISAVGGDDSSVSSGVPSNSSQYDFGEAPTVGIRDNVITAVYEFDASDAGYSSITVSYSNDTVIGLKGEFDVYDLSAPGMSELKSDLDNDYAIIKELDLWNAYINMVPGVNSFECDFNFSSLDGTDGEQVSALAAKFIGLSAPTNGKLYYSTVDADLKKINYVLTETY